MQMSSVKQELRFKYKDADKLPQLVEDIKEEIKKACPDAITDGTVSSLFIYLVKNVQHLKWNEMP